jgi:hypothetical protein
VIGASGGLGSSAAAPSEAQDERIFDALLVLERVQQAFYREAVESGRLTGDVLEYARAAGPQEDEHVRFLARRLGGRAGAPPTTSFGDALRDEASFRRAAIDLEEGIIAAYVGQGANLTLDAAGDVARIVSVEARQAAWVRALSDENPAPRAADPPREAEDVVADLRKRGWLR